MKFDLEHISIFSNKLKNLWFNNSKKDNIRCFLYTVKNNIKDHEFEGLLKKILKGHNFKIKLFCTWRETTYLFALFYLHHSIIGKYFLQIFDFLSFESVNVPQRSIDKFSVEATVQWKSGNMGINVGIITQCQSLK